MKKYIWLLCSVFFLLFVSCEDEKVDVTVMPAETTSGANTFGCLIDGWLYVGGRYYGLNSSSLNFFYQECDSTMHGEVQVKSDVKLAFAIYKPTEGGSAFQTQFTWNEEVLEDARIVITRFDKQQKIISGRFEGSRITHGRFDVCFGIRKDSCYNHL